MSFQDLESGAQRKYQRQYEDSSCEQHIKVNIQKIQESVRLVHEQLERTQRSPVSKRMCESLTKALERSQDVARETEQLFRAWTVHLAGEPRLRHMKKFAYEKLERSFKDEVANLKEANRRAIAAHKLAVDVEVPCPLENCSSTSDEEQRLLAGTETSHISTIGQDDLAILLLQRAEGVKLNQGQQFLALRPNDDKPEMPTRAISARMAGAELKQETADRRRSQFESICCGFAFVMVMVWFVLLHCFHIHCASLRGLAGIAPETATVAAASAQHSLILDHLLRVRLG